MTTKPPPLSEYGIRAGRITVTRGLHGWIVYDSTTQTPGVNDRVFNKYDDALEYVRTLLIFTMAARATMEPTA